MLDTGILLGRKRTMNISWTRCLGLTRGRAAISFGRRPRAVHGEAKALLRGLKRVSYATASNQWCAGAGVRRPNHTNLGAEGLATVFRNPERPAKSGSLKGAEEFLARINRGFLAVNQALRAEKTK